MPSTRRFLAMAAVCLAIGCSDTPDNSDPVSSQCASAPSAVTSGLFEFILDGKTRRFRLTVPAAKAGVAMPIIVAFQGGDGGDWPFPQQTKFEELAAKQPAIFVRPIANKEPENEGAWQLNTTDKTRQDIRFVDALLDRLSGRYCVDPKRIYATGYSLGSMFTYEVACQMNKRFAAVASFAGTMPVSPASCSLDDNIPVMHIHGVKDPIIAYKNSWDWKAWDSVGTMMDIPSLVASWGKRNGCQQVNELPTKDGLHVTHTDCSGGVRVEHHRLDDVGHDWPQTIDGLSTHQVIWDFLASFAKP